MDNFGFIKFQIGIAVVALLGAGLLVGRFLL